MSVYVVFFRPDVGEPVSTICASLDEDVARQKVAILEVKLDKEEKSHSVERGYFYEAVKLICMRDLP